MRLVVRTKSGQNTEGSIRNLCGSTAHTQKIEMAIIIDYH